MLHVVVTCKGAPVIVLSGRKFHLMEESHLQNVIVLEEYHPNDVRLVKVPPTGHIHGYWEVNSFFRNVTIDTYIGCCDCEALCERLHDDRAGKTKSTSWMLVWLFHR